MALKASGSSSANATASRMMPAATKKTGFESAYPGMPDGAGALFGGVSWSVVARGDDGSFDEFTDLLSWEGSGRSTPGYPPAAITPSRRRLGAPWERSGGRDLTAYALLSR